MPPQPTMWLPPPVEGSPEAAAVQTQMQPIAIHKSIGITGCDDHGQIQESEEFRVLTARGVGYVKARSLLEDGFGVIAKPQDNLWRCCFCHRLSLNPLSSCAVCGRCCCPACGGTIQVPGADGVVFLCASDLRRVRNSQDVWPSPPAVSSAETSLSPPHARKHVPGDRQPRPDSRRPSS